MSNTLKKVGQQASIYMVGVVINRLASFIMLPIYTSYLTPEDYGILEMLTLTVEVIGMIGLIGLSSAVFKFHAEYDGEQNKREVLSTATMGIMGLTALVAVLGVLTSTPLTDVVLGQEGRPLYFRIFFLIYLFQQWEVVPMLLLRLENRAWLFVGVGLAKLVSMLSLNILLVVFKGMGVLGVLTTNVLTSSVTSVLLLLYLFRSTGTHFSREKFGRMVRYGAPLVFWFLGSFVLVFSDRYFLKVYWGVGVVGVYSLGYRFVTLLSSLAFSPFQNVWEPERFRLAKEGGPEAGATFRNVFTYLNFGLAFVALGLALFTREVVLIMADEGFHDAYKVVPILLAAQIFYHWAPYANLGLLISDRTDLLGRLSVVSAVVVVIANLLLVPPLGMYGAALATLIAYGFRFSLVLVASQRLYRIDYDWGRVAATYGVVAGAVLLKYSAASLPILPSLALATVLTVVSMVGVYMWMLTTEERRFVRSGPRLLMARMGWGGSA